MLRHDFIAVTDLHLTDRPEDAYRWRVFEQIAGIARETKLGMLYVLGDLTEFKDYHSSRLVNRIVNAFAELVQGSPIAAIAFLKGNHDGLDPALPYFAFMRHLSWANFISEPEWQRPVLYLPHTPDPESVWGEPIRELINTAELILWHGTVSGAVSETGAHLSGISADWFAGARKGCLILAGDIHQPQRVGRVEYIGAPYPIRFGDSFTGSAAVVKRGKLELYHLENIRKLTLAVEGHEVALLDTLSGEAAPREGDQVRFDIHLSDSELGDYAAHKKAALAYCADRGAQLMKVRLVRKQTEPTRGTTLKLRTRTEEESLRLYCKANNVEEPIAEVGIDILKEEDMR